MLDFSASQANGFTSVISTRITRLSLSGSSDEFAAGIVVVSYIAIADRTSGGRAVTVVMVGGVAAGVRTSGRRTVAFVMVGGISLSPGTSGRSAVAVSMGMGGIF